MLTTLDSRLPDPLPNPTVNLGLDLAGGSHILLEAEASQVAAQRVENFEESVQNLMRDAEPRIRIGDVSRRGGRLSFMVENRSDVDRARELILPLVDGVGTVREWNLTVEDETRFILTPTEVGLETAIEQAMDSATEVVRRRIDELGTREPTIIRQGDTRIVVQVPGLQDPEQLKALLGQTARLEFKLVDQNALPADIAQGIAPVGGEIVPYAVGTPEEGQVLAVRRLGGIRGDNLTGAQQGNDPENNQPVVNIQFDQEGAQRFARLTQQNVGDRFAIILDDEALSAPVIREPITGGAAQISGSFTPESANALAISLRSGALPVDLTVIEERTVGPDLGADSVRAGLLAMGLGSLLVIALMIATYGRFGVYATVALVINVAMVLGVMALLNTTLTLPGIAGFVLTVGRGGGRQRADQRAHPRGAAARAPRGRGGRDRLSRGEPRDLRCQHHQSDRRGAAVHLRLRPGARFRGGAGDRPVHLRLHRAGADAHVGCGLSAAQAAGRSEHLRRAE